MKIKCHHLSPLMPLCKLSIKGSTSQRAKHNRDFKRVMLHVTCYLATSATAIYTGSHLPSKHVS